MGAARLRHAVSFVVIAATAATAAAIGTQPFAGPPPSQPATTTPGDPVGLAAREARAVVRLRRAERRLRAVAAGARAAPGPLAPAPAAPIVSVASAATVPVTSSGGS